MINFAPGTGRHFRPAYDSDFVFQLSVRPGYTPTVTSTAPAVDGDAEVTRTTTTHSDPYYDLEIQGPSTGVTLSALDATGSLVGNRLSRVSNGDCRVQAVSWLKTTQVTLDMTRINAHILDVFARYAAGSLARHIVDVMTALIGSKTAADKPLYAVQDHRTATYTRNPDCWAAPLDLTALSPWNSRGAHTRAGTAISPRHTIHAAHYALAPGDTIRFVTTANAVVTRTVAAVQTLADADLQIALLDTDLPATITPLKLLPADFEQYLPTLGKWPVPLLATDQQEHALTTETYPPGWAITNPFAYFASPVEEPFVRMSETIVAGDSGNPICAVINSAPVLVSHWYAANFGPLYSLLLEQVNAAMTTLGGGYTAQTVDLSSFPTYGA